MVFLTTIMVGCNSKHSMDEQLKEYFSEYSDHYCPIEIGRMMSVTKVEFDEGRVIFSMVVNDSIPGMDIYWKDENLEGISKYILNNLNFLSNNEERNSWIKSECSVIFKFVSKQNGKINLISFTPEQIKTAFETSIPSKKAFAREAVRSSILMEKRELPVKLGESELLTNISFGGDRVLYEVDIEDNKSTVLEKRKTIMREGLLSNLSKEYKGAENMFYYYIIGDISLEYIYTGTKSGTKCSIVITPRDLKGLNK